MGHTLYMHLCTEVVESWISLVATDREQVDVGEVRVHQSRVHAHSSCGWCSGGLWTEVKKVTFRAGTVEDVGVKRITTGRRGGLRGREKERISWSLCTCTCSYNAKIYSTSLTSVNIVSFAFSRVREKANRLSPPFCTFSPAPSL